MSRPTRSRRGSPPSFPTPPLLSVLRGDFLCLPFGGQTQRPAPRRSCECGVVAGFQSDRSITLQPASIRLRRDHRENPIHPSRPSCGLCRAPDFTISMATTTTAPIRSSIYQHCRKARRRISVSPFRWASVVSRTSFQIPRMAKPKPCKRGAEFTDLHIRAARRRRHHRPHPLSRARRKRRSGDDGQRTRHRRATVRMVRRR